MAGFLICFSYGIVPREHNAKVFHLGKFFFKTAGFLKSSSCLAPSIFLIQPLPGLQIHPHSLLEDYTTRRHELHQQETVREQIQEDIRACGYHSRCASGAPRGRGKTDEEAGVHRAPDCHGESYCIFPWLVPQFKYF
jgi:hypothetical protein